MGHDEQIRDAWDSASGTYSYEHVFRYVKPVVERSDIAIANLEVTLAGPPYKGYPQFSSPDALAEAARNAGFDIFIQANNHALDRGASGFKRTLSVLDSMNILHTGTFADSLEHSMNYPFIFQKNNIRIALLNYTYGTNGLEIAKPFIINRIDTALIANDLEIARRVRPDFIIVTIHWGEEYERSQNARQEKIAAFILNHGAGAIIGSHPHVVQPVELIDASDSGMKRLVVYSLGNFVSNQRAQYKDGGIMFNMSLVKTDSGTKISDFGHIPSWVYREDLPDSSAFSVIPVSLYERNNKMFKLKDADKAKIARFAADTREHLQNIPEIKAEWIEK